MTLANNWTPEQRARYYENARKKKAEIALAAGRVPGKRGQPAKNRTPEEKARLHRERVARYYFANHEKMKAYHAEWARNKAEELALAEERTPKKRGRPAYLTPEERRARKAARTRKNYHENLDRERARAARREREKRAALKAGTYKSKMPRLTDEERRLVNVAQGANRRARVRNAGGTYTAKDIQILHYRQGGMCEFCNMALGQHDIHVDHWVPLVKSGRNDRDNLRLLHGTCNLKKGAMHPNEFLPSYAQVAA